ADGRRPCPGQRDLAPETRAPAGGLQLQPACLRAGSKGSPLRPAELLDATHPDVVRLPVYWELVQPTPDKLDFGSVDELLDVIVEHNQASPDEVRVVLTVGARNFLFPELHQPTWAGPREQPNIGA